MTDLVLDSCTNPIDHLLEKLNVNSVFGKPAQAGDLTIIPVAEITTGFGNSMGGGQTASVQPGAGAATGGGGGQARPLGYIRIAPDGVVFEPTLDLPRIGLGSILLAGWLIFWIAQTIKTVKLAR